MEKQIYEMVKKLVHIPDDFNRRRDVSEVVLVFESGYLERHNEIDEDTIAEVLREYPDLIRIWMQWSEDKRSLPTWHFFWDKDENYYYVDYSAPGKENQHVRTQDGFQACAAFIKREIETDKILLSRK